MNRHLFEETWDKTLALGQSPAQVSRKTKTRLWRAPHTFRCGARVRSLSPGLWQHHGFLKKTTN
jgi:hypothetical protein